jgi:hypothetical protein
LLRISRDEDTIVKNSERTDIISRERTDIISRQDLYRSAILFSREPATDPGALSLEQPSVNYLIAAILKPERGAVG